MLSRGLLVLVVWLQVIFYKVLWLVRCRLVGDLGGIGL